MAKVVTSKQFSFSKRDIIRSLLIAVIVAVIPVMQEAKDTWVDGGAFVIDWRAMVDACWKATVGYLTLNFFSKGKVIALPESSDDLKTTENQVKRAV